MELSAGLFVLNFFYGLAFYLIGYAVGRKGRGLRELVEVAELKAKVKEAESTHKCSCTHPASMHDGGGCHGVVRFYETVVVEKVKETYGWNVITDERLVKTEDCRCVRFDGPDSTYALELGTR